MTTFPLKIALAATLAFALALTLSCSGNGGGGDEGGGAAAVKKEKVSGISQKGPFVGASVAIYELNAKFERTGNSFRGTTDGRGSFEIEINGTLASPYIVLEASGNYFNEVSGKPSTAPITLNAIANVSSKSRANINVLTNLEFGRVLKLVKSGRNFEEAKKQAQKEVLDALGMSGIKDRNSEDVSLFGSSPSDSVLLAVSVLLQADRSAEGVSGLLANLSREIEDKGTLSNSTKSEVDSGLANLDMDEVRDNIRSLDPNAKVPNFDKIDALPSSSSAVFSSSSIAQSSESTVPSSSSAVEVQLSSSSTAQSSSSGATQSSSSIAAISSSSSAVATLSSSSSTQSSSSQSSSSSVALSSSSSAALSSSSEANSSSSHASSSSANIFTDTRDNKTYKYVTIGEQVWMAENLNYNATGSKCYNDEPTNCAIYGKLYDGDIAKTTCPEGWHLPSDTEWTTLTNSVGTNPGTKLKSASGWNDNGNKSGNGTNNFGFSALPGGEYYITSSNSGFTGVGDNGYWWTATQKPGYFDNNFQRYMTKTQEGVIRDAPGRSNYWYSVRCVKD